LNKSLPAVGKGFDDPELFNCYAYCKIIERYDKV